MIELSPTLVVVLMFSGIFLGLMLGHPIAFVLGGLAVIFGFLGWGPGSWTPLVSDRFRAVWHWRWSFSV